MRYRIRCGDCARLLGRETTDLTRIDALLARHQQRRRDCQGGVVVTPVREG